MSTHWLSEIKSALRLAVPMAASQLAMFSLSLTDSIMCGQLGATQLAGAALGTTFSVMLWVPASGVLGAVAPLCAHARGAHEPDQIRTTLQQALGLCFLLWLPLLLFMSLSRPIFELLGQPADLIEIAESYLQACRWGLWPALGVTVLRSFLESMARPRPALVITISGVFFNILANWLLIFGKWGFPALGVAGTGWATSCVNLWMFLCLWCWCRSQPTLKPYLTLQKFAFNPTTLRKILRLGLPLGAGVLAEVWVFMGVAFLMGHFGTHALAAHQIAINIASGSFMVALGIANASTVRVGEAMGQKKYTQARQAGITGMCMGMSFMGCIGLMLWFFPGFLIGFYLDLRAASHQSVIALSTSLLRIAALFQIFDALQVTSQGALRGLQDTRIPMLISLGSYAGIGLGSGMILAYGFAWHETGLWIGLTLGLLTSGLALSGRFLSYFLTPKPTQLETGEVCLIKSETNS